MILATRKRSVKSQRSQNYQLLLELTLVTLIDWDYLSSTLVEELIFSRSRLYVSILKLCGNVAAERQTAKKGHVITFLQPDGPTKLAELQRTNTNFGDHLFKMS